MAFLIVSNKIMKSQSFEWLDSCVSDVILTNEHNMLIAANM